MPNLSSVASPPRRDLEYDALEIGEVIGSGGQAVVSKAYAPSDDGVQLIAVKQPARDAQTLPKETIDRFLAEAQTWATVDARERELPRWRDSEHIVGVIDFGDRLPWIALEYMDGGGLDDRLREHPDGLPLEEVLWIGECICKGVEVAHNYGIAHLDLKPANILFQKTPDNVWNVPKVADWGVARVLAEQTGPMDALSAEYAAPEQDGADQFGEPDMLTDIYQVGGLVYAMLTGSPPYTDPEPPSRHRDGIPLELDAAVMVALERKKQNRFQNIDTLGKALRAVRVGSELPPIVTARLKSHESQVGPINNYTSENGSETRDNEGFNFTRRKYLIGGLTALGSVGIGVAAGAFLTSGGEELSNSGSEDESSGRQSDQVVDGYDSTQDGGGNNASLDDGSDDSEINGQLTRGEAYNELVPESCTLEGKYMEDFEGYIESNYDISADDEEKFADWIKRNVEMTAEEDGELFVELPDSEFHYAEICESSYAG